MMEGIEGDVVEEELIGCDLCGFDLWFDFFGEENLFMVDNM